MGQGACLDFRDWHLHRPCRKSNRDSVTSDLWAAVVIPMNPVVAIFASLFTVCALLPVITSVFLGYRAGERLAISSGAISGLVLLMSCGGLAYLPHVSDLSGEGKRLAMAGLLMMGAPVLCTFMGNLVGYIAMGFLGSEQEKN